MINKATQSGKLLVLGSSGQIGSPLVSFLRNLNYEVYEYDIAGNENEDLRKWPNPELDGLISEADYVFFLAFDVGGSHYLEKYQDTFEFSENNLSLMVNTFRLLAKNKSKFLFASSQMASMSYSTYGLLKQIGEKMTTAIGGKVVHFWNVYGFESDESKFHVISDFIQKGLTTKNIEMRTTGDESRDFLYVTDCCEALKIVMENHEKFPVNMKIHITTGQYTKIIDIAKIIAEKLGATVKEGTKIDSVQRDAKNLPDLSFQDYWKPIFSIDEGISEIVIKMQDLEK